VPVGTQRRYSASGILVGEEHQEEGRVVVTDRRPDGSPRALGPSSSLDTGDDSRCSRTSKSPDGARHIAEMENFSVVAIRSCLPMHRVRTADF
jgi:hypothetical protein